MRNIIRISVEIYIIFDMYIAAWGRKELKFYFFILMWNKFDLVLNLVEMVVKLSTSDVFKRINTCQSLWYNNQEIYFSTKKKMIRLATMNNKIFLEMHWIYPHQIMIIKH